MKTSFKVLAIALLLVLIGIPAAVNAATDEHSSTQPPISQPLVREGTFAVKLAEALKLATPANESEAEAALVSAGIAPKNGWIGDYPVTPDIVGELQLSVSEAAAEGRLVLASADAAKAFGEVVSSYNLAVNAGPAPDGTAPVAPPVYDDSTLVENYYYDEGPPVVTYYAPPPDYAYLYTWVPYPFWGWDVWFPGFFVLADFDVDIGHHHHDGHHDGHHGGHDGHNGKDGRHGRDGDFVSNHFRDPNTGTFSRIDPANREKGGMLADRGGRWSNPSVQRSAGALFNRGYSARNAGTPNAGTLPSSGYRNVQPGTSGTRGGFANVPTGRSSVPTGRSFNGGRGFGGTRSSYTPAPGFSGTSPSIGATGSFSRPSYSGSSIISSGRSFSQPSYSRTPSVSSSSRSFSSMPRSSGFSGGRTAFNFGGHGASFGGGSRGGSFGGGRR